MDILASKSQEPSDSEIVAILKATSVELLLNDLAEYLTSASCPNSTPLRRLLRGLRSQPKLKDTELHNDRLQCLNCILNTVMRSNDNGIKSNINQDLVQLLQEEFGTFGESLSASELLAFVKHCEKEISENKEKYGPGFLEVFASLLSTLFERENITGMHQEDDEDSLWGDSDLVTGVDFKKKYVETLCDKNWSPKNVTAFCKLFIDIHENSPLSANEFGLAFDKLCNSLKSLDVNEVPPFVGQMLKLPMMGSSMPLIRALAQYFENYAEAEADVNSEDIIESENESPKALKNAAATVIYHIINEVQGDHPISKDLIKLLRCGAHVPDLVMNKFVLAVALALASIKHLKQLILDALKAVIVKSIVLDIRKEKCSWLRTTLDNVPQALALLNDLLLHSGCWEILSSGMIDLGFHLLDSSAGLGKADEKLRRIWMTGSKILVASVGQSSISLRLIMRELVDIIISTNAAPQYASCLTEIIQDSPMTLVIENKAILDRLVEQLCTLTCTGAKRLLTAIISVVRMNRSLKNSTILSLQKALFARSVETKKIGIQGVLHLLQIFRIASSLPVTQMSQSSSGLSQCSFEITQGKDVPNENFCYELIGALRKGLSQSLEVKMQIYFGLYDVTSKNPELCARILDLLQEHALNQGWLQLRTRADSSQMVNFVDLDTLVVEDNDTILLTESVGWFIFCLQQILAKSEMLYGDDSEDVEQSHFSTREKLNHLLMSWTNLYSSADIMDLGFVKDADYSQNSEHYLKAKQTLNIFEALMEYRVIHGLGSQEEAANQMIELQKRHAEVEALLKSAPAARGGEKRKKKKDENGDANPKGKDKAKKAKTTFKTPDYAFTLKGLSLLVKSLVSNETENEKIAVLQCNAHFTQFIFGALKEKLNQMDKTLESVGSSCTDKSSIKIIFKQMCVIGKLLMDALFGSDCSRKIDHDFDCFHAALEALNSCLKVLHSHFRNENISGFSLQIVGTSDLTFSEYMFEAVRKRIVKVIDRSGWEADEKATATGSLFKLLSFTTVEGKSFDNANEAASLDIVSKVFEWAKNFGKSSYELSAIQIRPFLELLFRTSRMSKANSSLMFEIAKEIHSKKGDLDNGSELEAVDVFQFISAETVSVVLDLVVVEIGWKMESVDFCIARCKQAFLCQEYGFWRQSKIDLAKSEFAICTCLARICNVLLELCQSNLSLEAILDQVVNPLIKLYSSLDSLAKYFLSRVKADKNPDSVLNARFNKLVQLSLVELKNKSQTLNLTVESKRDEEDDDVEGKKTKGKSAAQRLKIAQKQEKRFPKLEEEREKFEGSVKKLDEKCKLNLLSNVKVTMARDFRFKMAMTNQPEPATEDTTMTDASDSENDDPNAESTRLNESHSSNSNDGMGHTQRSVLEAGNMPPPNKKLKVQMSFNKNRS